jgi:spermidine dehydrogenase
VGPKPAARRYDHGSLHDEFGIEPETIRTFFTPGPEDGYGLGPDVLSAYCGITGGSMNRGSGQSQLSFPGGNDGIGRHIVKTLIPKAIPGPRTVEAVYRNPVDSTRAAAGTR